MLEELRAIGLETLPPEEVVAAGRAAGGPAAFDSSDGLSANEALAVALYLNPDLRAFRRERGIAEGELVSAGLLPNPEIQVTWLHIENFTKSLLTSGFGVDLNWAPPRPGERGAKLSKARARIEEVRAEIAGEEWRVSGEARAAYAAALAARDRLRLARASLRLAERVRKLLRDKLELGDANRLDVNLADIAWADALQRVAASEGDHDRVRQDLNRVLGLPPLYPLKLERAPGPDDDPPVLDPRRLETLMLERRPDVRAARAAYEQAEQDVHLAYIRRVPWPRFGPAYEREESEGGGGLNKFGVGVAIELPIANLNQGEIARLEAARDKQRETFTALVHRARAEVSAAYRNLQAQKKVLDLFERATRPALDENLALTESGLDLAEIDLVQFLTTQDRVIRSREDFLRAKLEYRKARYELETALGARLPEVGTGKVKAP